MNFEMREGLCENYISTAMRIRNIARERLSQDNLTPQCVEDFWSIANVHACWFGYGRLSITPPVSNLFKNLIVQRDILYAQLQAKLNTQVQLAMGAGI